MSNSPKALALCNSKRIMMLLIALILPFSLFAADGGVPSVGPVRIEFILFGLILLGVALFHKSCFCKILQSGF